MPWDVSSTSSTGTALAAIVIGGASGGALICAVLAAAHGLPRGPDSAFSDIALGAATAGLAGAAAVAFGLARPLGMMRSLLAAIVAVSGAALVAALTPVADITAGRTGLVVLAGVCGAIIIAAARLRPSVARAP